MRVLSLGKLRTGKWGTWNEKNRIYSKLFNLERAKFWMSIIEERERDNFFKEGILKSGMCVNCYPPENYKSVKCGNSIFQIYSNNVVSKHILRHLIWLRVLKKLILIHPLSTIKLSSLLQLSTYKSVGPSRKLEWKLMSFGNLMSPFYWSADDYMLEIWKDIKLG